jgi:hypothetical protein
LNPGICDAAPAPVQDLARFADTFAGLAEPDVMLQAWR